MALPRPVWPTAAIADLVAFFRTRERHHWAFAAISVFIPLYFVTLFVLEAETKDYKPPDIVWVTNLDANRTDAQIKADQKVDMAELKAQRADQKRRQEEHRRPFRELDEALDAWGL